MTGHLDQPVTTGVDSGDDAEFRRLVGEETEPVVAVSRVLVGVPCPHHADHDLLTHARLVVAGQAVDVDDARLLLEAAGLSTREGETDG